MEVEVEVEQLELEVEVEVEPQVRPPFRQCSMVEGVVVAEASAAAAPREIGNHEVNFDKSRT